MHQGRLIDFIVIHTGITDRDFFVPIPEFGTERSHVVLVFSTFVRQQHVPECRGLVLSPFRGHAFHAAGQRTRVVVVVVVIVVAVIAVVATATATAIVLEQGQFDGGLSESHHIRSIVPAILYFFV